LIESLCVIIAESYGHLGFEGLISCFGNIYLHFKGLFARSIPSIKSPHLTPFRHFFAAGLLGQEPLEAEVDVRERRNPPLETEFFTISGPFLALLPKVNI